MRTAETKIILYCADDSEIELPTMWVVCGTCDGRGTTCRHAERDGGGFTASEWAEEDPDFREDYLAGVYDRPCDECHGRTTVMAVDWDRLDPETAAAYTAQLQEDADYHALCAAERRAGC